MDLHIEESKYGKADDASFTMAAVSPALSSRSYSPSRNGVHFHRIPGLKSSPRDLQAPVVLRAAWSVLLALQTGSDEVVFGETGHGLNESPTRKPSPTSTLRMQIDWNMSLGEFLQRADKVETTGSSISMPGTSSHFHTLLKVVNNKTMVQDTAMKDDGPSSPHDSAHEDDVTYALVLDCEIDNEGMNIQAKFDSASISGQQAERTVQQLEHLLQQIHSMTSMETKVAQIGLLNPLDKKEIQTWNGAPVDAVETCVHNIIAANVASSPNAPAICAWDGELTYSEMDNLSTQLAHHLSCNGVKKDIIVALCFEKSMWTPVAQLAVMKAGGASVVLDTGHPEQRLRSIIEQSNPLLVLSSAQQHSLATRLTNHPIEIVDMAHILALSSITDPLPAVDPSSMLYVVFTSGSTGTPKGVVITHSNFSSAIKYQQSIFRLSPTSRVYDHVSYAFDVSWGNVLHALASGACLCIPSDSDRRSAIAESMEKLQVNYAALTPTVARLVKPDILDNLETLILTGEKVTQLDSMMRREGPGLLNAYGPAECSVWSTIEHIQAHPPEDPSIGKGFGLHTWIVHPETGGLAPIGAPGELWLEGPLVGRGYLHDPFKSAAAFVASPPWVDGSGSAGSRGPLYRTGDIVRYNDDGSLVYLGRKDAQVKIRGQRVELSEVEHHHRTTMADSAGDVPLVAEVITPHGSSTAVLAVFLQVGGTTASQEDRQETVKILADGLSDQLQHQLPMHMVPSYYIGVDSIPVTGTGKTDRRQLRDLGSSFTLEQLSAMNASQRAQRRVAISNLESHLQRLWAVVLGIDISSIGFEDSFLRIGGDSVTAMRLVALAREESISITVAQVFQTPRLDELAKAVNYMSPESHVLTLEPFSLMDGLQDVEAMKKQAAEICGISPGDIEDIFPCTPLQEGLLALTEKSHAKHSADNANRSAGDYVAHFELELQQKVDVHRLKEAWSTVVAATPILRTRIVHLSGSGFCQVVVNEPPYWKMMSLTSSANVSQEPEVSSSAIMGIGTRLNRFEITQNTDSDGKKWLSWIVHHALYDGWSLPLIFERLETAYVNNTCQPSPPFQAFIKHVVENSKQESAETYWTEQFKALAAVPYPSLKSTVHQPTADVCFTTEIPNLHWVEGITPTSSIRAAWSVLTAHYTDTDDVIFGATVAGRQAAVPGIEGMTGPTITTVPLRVPVAWNKSVREFQEQIQQQAVDMIAFEQTGLHRIQTMNADTKAACQFQTLLVVQPYTESSKTTIKIFCSRTEEDLIGVAAEQLGSFESYAMMLECFLLPNGMKLRLSCDSSIVQEQHAKRISQQFENVIRQMCNPELLEQSLNEIESIDLEDLEVIWARNAVVPEAAVACVHDLISNVARRQPSACAISAWDGQLSYAELDRLSTAVAHDLVGLGVKPETIVPVCMEKSLWTPVTILAVMKTGGATVALDPSQPEERLQKIVRQVNPPVIVSSPANEGTAIGLAGGKAVLLIGEKHLPDDSATMRSLPKVSPQNMLYLVFTSGSTGEPKGVIITHSNMASVVQHQSEIHGVDSTSRVYDFASPMFDAAWSNLVQCFTRGACLCIPSDWDRKNDLAGSLARFQATYADLTPSTVRTLPVNTIGRLSSLIVGGEKLPPELAQQWAKVVDLKNIYGPSECTPTSTIAKIDPDHGLQNTIGKGAGLCTWIVSSNGHLTPLGASGELWLEGPLVGRGYLNNPEKTEKAFVTDPAWLLRGTARRPGRHGRLYRTGDIVRYNPDGSLAFINRDDAQVKIRGQRVELGDIESHIQHALANDDVDVVAEIITPQQSSNALLVTFVEASKLVGQDASPDRLAEAVSEITAGLDEKLRAVLPVYMIPTAYLPVAALPISNTGKIDRKHLRGIGQAMTLEQITALNSQGERREPETDMERRLAQLWALVLGIPPDSISRDDGFLQIGGDSIGAMRLVSEARAQGLSFTVADVFKKSTLSALAEVVSGSTGTPAGETITFPPFALLKNQSNIDSLRSAAGFACGVQASQIEDIFPCTPLQEGLLALTTKHSGDYIARHVLELRPDIDVARFLKAWEGVVSSIPTLRTRIVDLDDAGLSQVVINEAAPCQHFKLNGEQVLELDRGTDLSMGLGTPLMHSGLFEKDGNHYFAWNVHHALYDGWSMALIFERLHQLYIRQPTSPMAPFQGFISHVQNIDQKASTEFWTEQFNGSEASPYPSLSCKPPGYHPSAEGLINSDFDGIDWVHGTTPSTAIRLALSMLLTWHTDRNDVIFGAMTTGRQASISDIEMANLAAPTIATVPVRVMIDTTKTVGDMLQQLQLQAAEMTSYEQMGLQQIRRVSKEADLACRFQTFLLVQPADDSQKSMNELFEPSNHTTNSADAVGPDGFNTYGLIIECQPRSRGLHMQMNFDTELIGENQAWRLAHQFEFLLRQICMPENGIKQLAALDKVCQVDAEEIWGWNHSVPDTVNQCVHTLIEKTMQQRPSECAVDAWDGSITYGELNDLSTKLAHHLIQSFGIGPELIVPLCFEKSKWMPVAMLGVMKAGGASVAMEMSQPEERLVTIMEQVKPAVVLCSSKYESRARSLTAQPVILLDQAHWSALPSPTDSQVLPIATPSNLCYVVFTSGSTGTPKGVMVPHSALSSAIHHQRRAQEIGIHSRVFDFSSYAFDVTWANTCVSLEAGGCLCIPSDDDRKANLAGAIEKFKVTHIDITPSAAITIPLETVQKLDTLILGGETLPADYVERWAALTNVKNSYGPCECTPTSTFTEVLEGGRSYTGTIGKGFGVNTWIADTTAPDRLAPIGVAGELCLEGPIVGRGYLGEESKTTGAFITDPEWLLKGANGHPGRRGRVYKTGDIVKYNAEGDGGVTFVGRKDAQVKIRGQRVELDEVEFHVRANLQHDTTAPIVADVIKPKDGSNAMLVAFLEQAGRDADHDIASGGPLLDASSLAVLEGLNDRLETQVPVYMIPAAYVILDSMPMTPTGKTDRRRLRRLAESLTLEQLAALNPSRGQRRAPETDMERRLQQIWSSVLGIDPDSIGLDDSFVRIGGDSIRIMVLLKKIMNEFGLQMTFERLLQTAKLGDLAQEIMRSQAGQEDTVSVEAQMEDIRSLGAGDGSLPMVLASSGTAIRRVFLTGATGYLGNAILHHLHLNSDVLEVAVLVRAKNQEEAKKRIVDVASHAGWWSKDQYESRISFWLGDLQSPRLGLSDSQWAKVSGTCDPTEAFDGIVHCGAKVDWYSNYSALRSANVMSAVDLYRAVKANPAMKKYVYVSTNPEPHDALSESSIREALRNNGGYGQTKLVAAHVLLQTLIPNAQPDPRISVIKPGLIIGSASSGVANPDDFVWRVVAASVSVGCYPEEPSENWVYISSTDGLASSILKDLFAASPSRHSIYAGLPASKFWDGINSVLSTPLKPMHFDLWREDVSQRLDEKHPVFPVMGFIEKGEPPLGAVKIHDEGDEDGLEDWEVLKMAVASNVSYLLKTGYFDQGNGDKRGGGVFRRGIA